DVGSNSLHMLVADVSPDGRIQVVDRLKEMVRLGRRAFTSGKLDREAAELALRTLKTFERLARARHVERLGAVATSAVREARNGAAFVRLLRRETGIPVRIISGPDEARLIFRAARHALGLDGGPHLLVDVGGGSVELVLVRDGRALWMRSLPLRVARLTERFLIDDPPRTGQVRQLEKHLRRELGEVLARVRRAGTLRAIGTSGTVNALVAMACAARGEDVARLHGARARAAEIARLRQRILGAGAARRASLPGIDTKRVDPMPAAVVLLDLLLGQARHPRHSAYLIRTGELLGFEPLDIEMLALVARGHRKQLPSPSDPDVQVLPPPMRRRVRALAALLRVADALDRTQFSVVRSIRTSHRGGRLLIEVDSGKDNAELELWAAQRRVDLLARLLDRPV